MTEVTRLPDFVVAGVRKCATTWLHQCLSEHPQIFVPAEAKELFFFDRHWNRGTEWYGKYFRDCPPNKICGEATPGYFSDPDAPARMLATIPDAKIVFLFRNPVDRAVSLYHHIRALGGTNLSFAQALEDEPLLLDEGRYHHHFMRFQNLFGKNAVLAMILEDVRAAGPAGLAELFRFLGVDDTFHAPSFFEKTYQRREPRGRILPKIASGVANSLRDIGLHSLTNAIKKAGAERVVYKSKVTKLAPLPEELLLRLKRTFRPEAQRLGDGIGRDLVALWKLDEAPGSRNSVRTSHIESSPQ